jgi:hypothetical protein
MDRIDEAVCNELYRRRDEAVCVPKVEVRLGDWTPCPAHCHENVDKWLAATTAHKAVRGWLVEDVSGGQGFAFYFNAHSVVEVEDGMLIDITPSNVPCGFLRHIGTDEDFERFKVIGRLEYLPFGAIHSRDHQGR